MGRYERVLRFGLIDLYDTEEKDLEYWKNKEKEKEDIRNFSRHGSIAVSQK
jgi:hypothetical protein